MDGEFLSPERSGVASPNRRLPKGRSIKKMGLDVALMFNLGKYDPPQEGEPPDANAELDSERTVMAVAEALRAGGHRVTLIEGNLEAYPALRRSRTDMVFNICEGVQGESRESQVPAMLEMLGIPYTGSGPLALALSLDKPTAKKVFAYHGVASPRFRSFEPGEAVDTAGLRFPLFVKPAREGSSMGISPQSRVENPAELVERVHYIHRLYHQAALVEEFLVGREFTVGLVGNHDLTVFPVMEINYDPVPEYNGRIYDYQFKQEWDDWRFFHCPAPISRELEAQLKETAVAAWRSLGCVDVGRVDLRLDADGVPNALEVNPLPGLSPGYSDLCRLADIEGMGYTALVNRIINAAIERYGLSERARAIV